MIRWLGHLASAEDPTEDATIARLAVQLRTMPLARSCADLSGVFGLFVFDRARRAWQAACDNAGLYRIFYDDRSIGTSLLELVAARPAGASAVCPERAVEHLAHGGVFGAATLVAGVRKIRADEVVELTLEGRIRHQGKTLRKGDGDAGATLGRYFTALARSLQGRRVSADVTGGLDTRLNICLLHHHKIAFELATSGRPGVPDADVAFTIARLMGRPLQLTPHRIDRLEADLETVFRAGDGQADLRLFHRNRQNALARLARGVEVIVHGGGGDCFRDFFYARDFPWLGSRRVDFERFYDLQIAPTPLPSGQLTATGAALLSEARRRTLAGFARHRSRTNTLSYGKAAYFFRVPETYGPIYSSYVNMGLDVVAPFIELANARLGTALPIRDLFLGRWHRRMITTHWPELAALPTALGGTAASALPHALMDAPRLGAVFLARSLNKLSQRARGRSLIPITSSLDADAPGYLEALRATRCCRLAVERLKALDILAPWVTPAALRGVHVSRVMQVGMLLEHLDGLAAAGPLPVQPRAGPARSRAKVLHVA